MIDSPGLYALSDPFPTPGIAFYKGLKVTVLGATGLIGSYVVKLLKESGAITRSICHRRLPNSYTLMASDTQHLYDLGNHVEAIDALGSPPGTPDVVLCCAGITGGVNLPSLDPVSYVGPATAIVINSLHAAFVKKVPRFGFLSSTTVYAPSETPAKEDDVDTSNQLYPLYRGIGESKRFLEKLCLYYHETTKIGVGVVRPSGAYGRFDNFDEKTSHVLPGMVDRALKLRPGQPFEIWGDGQDVRDFIHAQDVARCLLLAVARQPDATPINAASGQGITTMRLAEHILEAVGSRAEIKFNPGKPSALRTRTVDVSRAKKLLDFKAQISLPAGILDVVNWRRLYP